MFVSADWRCSVRSTRLLRALALGAVVTIAASVAAQRVQIPAGGGFAPATAAPPSTFAPPAPAWAPPTYSAPPFSAPPPTPPGFGLGAPALDPYGGSAPFGPPPASLPYSYSGSPAGALGAPTLGGPAYGAPGWGAPSYSPNAPIPNGGFASDGSPLGWQPGSYGFEGTDGSTVTFRQFLARLRGEHTLLLGDNSTNSFEVNRTEIAATFAFPIAGQIESPVLVTPGFAFNWFNGPDGDPAAVPRGPDMPPVVFDAYVDFSWFPKFTERLGAEFGARTGVWTDFDEVNEDSIRVLGRALGVVSVSPQFDVLFGVVYLDRLRVKTLPAGGVRWRPTPEWDLYLVFPNPKIRRALPSTGAADWWWYVAGEYGGGSWTVNRSGTPDRIDYNDVRLSLGIEWQTNTQASGHAEVGYALDRELLFGDTDDPARAKLDDALMFRVGIGY
ncbi:MAG: DUF6268 family outer membrane beta-barrel protein [Lacipirellulaceae bacterium]